MKNELLLSIIEQFGIDKDFKINENDLNEIKNHPLFANLNLTNSEISENIIYLKKIIDEKNRCTLSDANVCPYNSVHLYVKRANDKISFYNDYCDKMRHEIESNLYKKNILFNYYENSYDANNLINIEFKKDIEENYKNTGKISAINRFLKNMSQNNGKGMYLYGEPGVGKTYLLLSFANSAAKFFNKKVAIVFVPDLVENIKNKFDETYYKKDNDELIDILKNVDVLFLDDIGAEYGSEWFYANHLLNILNYRYASRKMTFFSSNITIDKYMLKIKSKIKSPDAYINAKRIIQRINELVNNEICTITKENK